MSEAVFANALFSYEKYDYRIEAANKNPYSGTIMPLSAICLSQQVRYTWTSVPMDKYDTGQVLDALYVDSTYHLNEAGRRAFEIQNRIFKMERSRTDGTLAVWLFRQNERKRQTARLRKWLKDAAEGDRKSVV